MKYEPMTQARRYAIEREAVKQRSFSKLWQATESMSEEAIAQAAARADELFLQLEAADPFGRPKED